MYLCLAPVGNYTDVLIKKKKIIKIHKEIRIYDNLVSHIMIKCANYGKCLPHTGPISISTSQILTTRHVLQCPTHRDFIFFAIAKKY